MKTISLCMIVRDEEKCLRQCLDSIKELVDEIIVVDTGSVDATKGIASQFGAEVIDFKWRNDFGWARNALLHHATSDWILILDADEIVPEESLGLIKGLTHRPYDEGRLPGYQFVIENQGDETVNHYLCRLFPNHKSLRYEGIIHEQLLSFHPDITLDLIKVPNVKIIHYGYTTNAMKSRNKVKRNLDLLALQVEEEPNNPFHHANIGFTYLSGNEKEKAYESFITALSLTHGLDKVPHYMVNVYISAAALALDLKNLDSAFAIISGSPQICQSDPNFWVNYGNYANEMGHFRNAIKSFNTAIDKIGQNELLTVFSVESTAWKPYAGLGNSYSLMKMPDLALKNYEKALELNPYNDDLKILVVNLGGFPPFLMNDINFIQIEEVDNAGKM